MIRISIIGKFIMNDRLTDIIARETCGKSYRARKYGFDVQSYTFTAAESSRVWQHSAESSHKNRYIDLQPLSRKLAASGEQLLSYFLDGSRRVFKVDEIAYEHSGGRKTVYPVIAGQITAGCCCRVNRKILPGQVRHEIVIALPEIADPDGKPGFFQAVAAKLNASPSLMRFGIRIDAVLKYSSGSDTKLEDKATAAVQDRMIECEKELTDLTAKRLDSKNYLVKDGSLEYSHKSKSPLTESNYRWVLGLSKSFNPSSCMNSQGRPDPGYIADLPEGHRTQAACFTNDDFLDKMKFAVWYIRLHSMTRTSSAFDGVVKAEKLLTTSRERDKGIISSEEIDILSAYILNERYPVCYGSDSLWANHIYQRRP